MLVEPAGQFRIIGPDDARLNDSLLFVNDGKKQLLMQPCDRQVVLIKPATRHRTKYGVTNGKWTVPAEEDVFASKLIEHTLPEETAVSQSILTDGPRRRTFATNPLQVIRQKIDAAQQLLQFRQLGIRPFVIRQSL